jgi:hypothetical protein
VLGHNQEKVTHVRHQNQRASKRLKHR